MMKKLIYSIAVITAATAFFLKANKQSGENLSDYVLANVEALASGEGGEAVITCSAKCSDGIGKCWTRSEPKRCVRSGSQYDYCHTDMDGGRTCVKIDGETYN